MPCNTLFFEKRLVFNHFSTINENLFFMLAILQEVETLGAL
jgi:hypothetical protein